ncbi:MAG TPA: hypothetical protein VNS79_09500 [Sphingobium sp.]|nr:hypothetical protein [Sphingobium sp.]
MTQIVEQERLTAAAARIRASQSLGRSGTLYRLFDYLLERTLEGEAPKEVEIAGDVFGKTGSDLLVDASVRVYIHRLRKKMEEYYAGPGHADPEQLILPKGEYRFQLSSQAVADPLAAEADPASEVVEAPATERRQRWLFLLLGLIVGGALVLMASWLTAGRDPLDAVRTTSIWKPIIESRRALILVPGDYYIMGERDKPDADPARLVREYAVNSREELDEWFMREPSLRQRYVDLNLFYLPVSAGYALKTLMPILTPPSAAGRASWLVPSSKLTPNLLKDGDLVYIGLLSGLDLLQQPVFAHSRFAFAGSFDEIIDSETGKLYTADPPRDPTSARRNYAYIARLPGPNGNHILVIAGTRDPALLQAVDIMSNPATLKQLEDATKSRYFEALYAVDGVGESNLRGTLIAAAARSVDGIWDAELDAGPQ